MSVPMEYSLLICFRLGFFYESYLNDILADCLMREIRVTSFDKNSIAKIIPEKADLLKSYFAVGLVTSYDRNAISMYQQYLYSDYPNVEVFFIERE